MISPNGFDNLLWFMGIVEDNIDPTNHGRVKVRVFGIHPPYDTGEVETEDLPWAVPINGTYNDVASIPKKADWVFGFFIDGRDAQHPMILGTVPGQNYQLPTDTGSSDSYIKPSIEAIKAFARAPLHPLKIGEDLETLAQTIIQDSSRIEGSLTNILDKAKKVIPDGVEKDLKGLAENAQNITKDLAGSLDTLAQKITQDAEGNLAGLSGELESLSKKINLEGSGSLKGLVGNLDTLTTTAKTLLSNPANLTGLTGLASELRGLAQKITQNPEALEEPLNEILDKAKDAIPAIRKSIGWDEPPTPMGAEPHKTTVMTSNYGDSYVSVAGEGDNESIVLSHASGSHIQVDSSGNIKIKSFGDSYNISEGHSREYVEGRKEISINGSYILNVKNGDCTLEVQGDLNHIVHGDYNLNVARRMSVSIGQGLELAAQRMSLEAVSEHINIISAEKIKMSAGDSFSAQSGDRMYLTSGARLDMDAAASAYLSSASNINLTGAGVIAGDAGEIHFNSGLSSAAEATPEVPSPPNVDEPTSEGVTTDGTADSVGSPSSGMGSDSTDDDDSGTGGGGADSGQAAEDAAPTTPTSPPPPESSFGPGMTEDKASAIQNFAAEYGMNPNALAGILAIESNLDPSIQGGASNRYHGIFQLEDRQIGGLTRQALGQELTPDQYRNLSFNDQLQVYGAYISNAGANKPGFFTGDARQDAARLWALQLAPSNASRIDYNNPNAVISRTRQADAISASRGLVTVGSVIGATLSRGKLD